MEPKKILKNQQGEHQCPNCGGVLQYIEGQPVSIVDGKVNMEDTEGKYYCKDCNIIFRRLLTTEYYQGYDGEIKSEIDKADWAKRIENFMPVKLNPNSKTDVLCPICNYKLKYIEGQPIQIINGKFNMEDTKGRFYCSRCKSEYRQLLATEYYQHYPSKEKKVEELAPIKLDPKQPEKCHCPICHTKLTIIEGKPVHIKDGKLNMKDTETHFKCPKCQGVYRRLVNTEYYQWYED